MLFYGRHLAVRLSLRIRLVSLSVVLSPLTYISRAVISLLSGAITMKRARNRHHVSGHWWKRWSEVRGQGHEQTECYNSRSMHLSSVATRLACLVLTRLTHTRIIITSRPGALTRTQVSNKNDKCVRQWQRHFSGTTVWWVQSRVAVPKEVCLQATAENRQWRCRRDMLRQTVPNSSCGDRKGSVADSWQPQKHTWHVTVNKLYGVVIWMWTTRSSTHNLSIAIPLSRCLHAVHVLAFLYECHELLTGIVLW